MANELDPTVRLAPGSLPEPAPEVPPAATRRPAGLLIGGGLAVAALLGGLLWVLLPGAPPGPAPEIATAPPRPVPPASPLLEEAAILLLQAEQPRMVRVKSNPRVFVLLFTGLEQQGAALNRIAALVEKRGLPRDRLLNEAELAAAIAASGDTPATWFYGHDYRLADLTRFFALAERDRVALNEAELWVRDRLREAVAQVAPGESLALVSAANAGPRMDAAMRAAILKHELSHGHYFTWPGFAEHVHMVWRDRFTEADRQALTSFLGREGYDTGNAELMANEAMAYLLFTPDARIFSAAALGVAEAQLERLRGLMREGLPLP
ncbi:hypothetical protein [Siccirubricoccus phaeus]|uniref:hypothetical protein n=1 Tax=Siccirubricoccus phaeus TaxID=2595053 RepID=UPI0011F3829A|nr:hypothetical protein [Siccirubricoccus phaeus]